MMEVTLNIHYPNLNMKQTSKIKIIIIIFFSVKPQYTLSFEYTFIFEDDEVYFAYCIPYTYSRLLHYLNK